MVTDSLGAQATATAGPITVRSTLVASAGVSAASGDVPVSVTFTGSATGGAGSYSYGWAFGDGVSSTVQNPSHTYTSPARYVAKLTVTDASGVTATASVTIAVAADPGVTAAGSPSIGDVPLAVAFTATVAGGTSPFTYAWDFGDGSSSATANPGHTYTAVRSYSAGLTITDAVGQTASASVAITVNPPPAASASAAVSTGDAPLTVNFSGSTTGGTPTYIYQWSFGDGTTSHGSQSPSHTYTVAGSYTAVFTATDAAGQSTSASVSITVNPPPAAAAAVSATAGNAPLAVNFTGSASGGMAPYSYAWSFGDGGTSNSQNPGHTYAAAGIYTATLMVTDATGATAGSSAGPITVHGPLAALAGAAPAAGDAPVAVAFTGMATGGTLPYTYIWAFGDGTSATGQNPGHTYTSAGTFVATLTISDGSNNSAVATAAVVVSPGLSATSSATQPSGTAPVAVVDFTGTAIGGKAPYNYAWAFGDGGTSTSQNPSHTYSSPGTFSATLTVTDGNGASASASPLAVSIAPGPLVVTAATTKSVGDAPVSTTLTSSVTGGTPPFTYLWDLGDGSSSTAAQPNHTYASAGDFTATVTVTDSRGVTSQATAHLTVYNALNITVSATPAAGGAPLQVAFSASATGGLAPYSFSWNFGDGSSGTGATAAHSYGGGSFSTTLTVHDAAGGSWTGATGTITSTAPNVPPTDTSGGGNQGAGSGPGAGATPTPPPSTPSQPSPSPEPSPSSGATPPVGGVTNEPPAGSGGGSVPNNAGMILVVIGSTLAAGWGGRLFLGWRRRRLL